MTDVDASPVFQGAAKYVLDEELAKIVNVSIKLEMPLLLKGEPATGKTMLAHAIAENLQMPLLVLNVKSSMKLIESLYQYDTLTRLNDSRFGDSKRDVSNIDQPLSRLILIPQVAPQFSIILFSLSCDILYCMQIPILKELLKVFLRILRGKSKERYMSVMLGRLQALEQIQFIVSLQDQTSCTL